MSTRIKDLGEVRIWGYNLKLHMANRPKEGELTVDEDLVLLGLSEFWDNFMGFFYSWSMDFANLRVL